jgi:exodeoxyribonuclease III
LLPCRVRLVSWNVNGIRAVQRKGLFDPFVAATTPDVICLQETKADEVQAACQLEGYGQFWHPALKKGYSGVAILSQPAPLAIVRGLPKALITKHGLADDTFGNPNEEGRVVTAEYEGFYLVNAYTPNSKGDLTRLPLRHQRWDPAFRAYLVSLRKKKPVAVCGDLNVAHTDDDVANGPGPLHVVVQLL